LLGTTILVLYKRSGEKRNGETNGPLAKDWGPVGGRKGHEKYWKATKRRYEGRKKSKKKKQKNIMTK